MKNAFYTIQYSPCFKTQEEIPFSPQVLEELFGKPEAQVFREILEPMDAPTQEKAQAWQKWEHVIVLGMGGPSMACRVLKDFASHRPHAPNIHFIDNIDPHTLSNISQKYPLEKTGVVVFSKSGGTLETLMQLGVFVEAFQEEGIDPAPHFLAVTEEASNPVRKMTEGMGADCLTHHPHVGGRYSLFHTPGQFIGLLLGLDMKAMRQAAASVLQDFHKNPVQHSATQGAYALVQGHAARKPVHVFNPYGDTLESLAPWYVQIWAESIGKDGKGSTPLGSVGSNSQHSLLQLMLDGPNDKMVTIIAANAKEDITLQKETAALLGRELLQKVSIGQALAACAEGTFAALKERNVPTRLIHLENQTEETLGALVMHFMLETVMGCYFEGVNPFDQPAVEEGKKCTMALLNTSS